MSKYNEVLQPFMQMMDAGLHANSAKGDRPGWLSMTAEQCLLEIYYHVSKLQKAVRDGNGNRIKENAADVANMAMMLADICGALEMAQPSDGALTPEPFFYAMCGPDGKPHYQEYCVSAKAHHLEPDADGVTIIPVFKQAPAAASVILPPAPEMPEEPPFADDDSHMDAYHAACRMRAACAKAIAAAGVGLRLEP